MAGESRDPDVNTNLGADTRLPPVEVLDEGISVLWQPGTGEPTAEYVFHVSVECLLRKRHKE
jgi:hypothetical protein